MLATMCSLGFVLCCCCAAVAVCVFAVCCAPIASSTLRLLSIMSVILVLSSSLSLCSLIAESANGVTQCSELNPSLAAAINVLMCVSLLELNS